MCESLELDFFLLKIIWFHKAMDSYLSKCAPNTNLKIFYIPGIKYTNGFSEYKDILSRSLAFKKIIYAPSLECEPREGMGFLGLVHHYSPRSWQTEGVQNMCQEMNEPMTTTRFAQ